MTAIQIRLKLHTISKGKWLVYHLVAMVTLYVNRFNFTVFSYGEYDNSLWTPEVEFAELRINKIIYCGYFLMFKNYPSR